MCLPAQLLPSSRGLPAQSLSLLCVKWENDLPYHGSGEEAATFQTLPLHPTPPTGTSRQGLGSAGGASVRGRGLGRPGPMGTRGGGDLLPALSSTRILLAVPSTSRVPQRSPTPAHPQPTRPACSPLLLFPDLSPRPSGLDIMGDGGEGEDEVQFLRTVRISVLGGVTGATSRVPLSVSLSPDVSVRIAGDLGVSGPIPLSLWVTVTLSRLSPSRSPFSS